MTDTKSESGTGHGPGRRGRFFDDLAGVAGGPFPSSPARGPSWKRR
ncbi:hypothetical protein ACFQU7_02685 [Pseudoroseomonas wenyumeiae]